MSRPVHEYRDLKRRGLCPTDPNHKKPLPGRTYCEDCAAKFRLTMRLRRGAALPKIHTETIRVRL